MPNPYVVMNEPHRTGAHTAGYAHVGIKPSHGTRGGDSSQHTSLVHAICAHVPGAHMETTLG